MSLKILQNKNVIKNSIKSKNTIEVSFYQGNIESNLLVGQAESGVICNIKGLDFSCENNTQYIPVI